MWFAASLLLESIHDIEPRIEGIWEEAIVLVEADHEREAREKAIQLGKAKEHEYYAEEPQRHKVTWVFECVERIVELSEQPPREGAEVFSRYLRRSEVQSLLIPFDNDT